jgi:hypothetical protein
LLATKFRALSPLIEIVAAPLPVTHIDETCLERLFFTRSAESRGGPKNRP